MQRLTVLKITIVIADALSQIEVALSAIAITVEKGCAEDRDFAITLDGEVNILG